MPPKAVTPTPPPTRTLAGEQLDLPSEHLTLPGEPLTVPGAPTNTLSRAPLTLASAPSSARPPNFGRFARVYAGVEWLTFGRALSRRRECFLGHASVATAKRVLVLGDGDGRFTAALLEQNPFAAVTALDVSAAMLSQLESRARAKAPNARLELHCADARTWSVPLANYDLVVAHFFFDCFTTDELAQVVERIAPALGPDACWLVSDFAIPDHRFWTPFAKVLLRFLYLTIGSLTGLEPTQLPDHRTVMKYAGFELAKANVALGGTLRSEVWQRKRSKP